jgi:hypothetical protein
MRKRLRKRSFTAFMQSCIILLLPEIIFFMQSGKEAKKHKGFYCSQRLFFHAKRQRSKEA